MKKNSYSNGIQCCQFHCFILHECYIIDVQRLTLFYDTDMIYLLAAIGLTPGGSSTVHIYTQTIYRTTQLICEYCGPCPVFASYTLAFVLQLSKKHGKIQGSRRMPVGTTKIHNLCNPCIIIFFSVRQIEATTPSVIQSFYSDHSSAFIIYYCPDQGL